MRIVEATTPDHLAVMSQLFQEYANSIETDLCFQDFQHELDTLPGKYAPPRGRLLIAVEAEPSVPQNISTPHSALPTPHSQPAAGCVGLRPLDDNLCEMKRLFVRPAYRGRHLGRDLALAVIAAARQAGFTAMRLDTLASMKEAHSLYRSLGFTVIEPYCHNPNPGVIYMELALNTSRQTASVA